MVTIKEVAHQAGVSVATVSRVINQSEFVHPDLVLRVQTAIRQLHYQPNALAKNLRHQRSQTIGILIPQLDQPFFGMLAFAIEKTLFTHNYRTLICSAEENLLKETRCIDMFLQQRVDGVVIVPTPFSAANIQRLRARQIPVLLVDRDLPDLEDVQRVLVDNYQGGYLAVQHLLHLEHERVGIVGSGLTNEPILHRLRGAEVALQEVGLTLDPDLVVEGDLPPFELGYQAAQYFMQQRCPPTAIFALTDVVAVGVLHALGQMNHRIPQDVSVVGFDNLPLAAYILPELTTIAQPIYAMGAITSDMLLGAIRDSDYDQSRCVLAPELIIRNSTHRRTLPG